MAVYFHKTKKKWLVDVWHNGQRFKSGSFKNKLLAEKSEREWLSEIDQIKLTGVQFKDLSYNELYALWLESASYRKRETSLVKDQQMHRDFISPVIGDLKTSQIKPMHFEKIVSLILKKKLTKSSVNKVIQHFKAVFNHSFNNETIARNPAKSFKQLKLDSKEMDYFHQEELDQFLSFANQKYANDDRIIYVLYLTLFLTGMRLGEALGLDFQESFDFVRNTITVKRIWSQSEMIIVDTTKGKKDRMIPIPTILRIELLRLRNTARSGLVFSKDGLKPIDPDNLRSRHWERDIKEASVRRIRIHDARHTYGALFMMNGGNIYELSKILGHSSIKTTERYAHLSNDHLAGVRDMVQPNLTANAEIVSLNKSRSLPNHCRDDLEDNFLSVSD